MNARLYRDGILSLVDKLNLIEGDFELCIFVGIEIEVRVRCKTLKRFVFDGFKSFNQEKVNIMFGSCAKYQMKIVSNSSLVDCILQGRYDLLPAISSAPHFALQCACNNQDRSNRSEWQGAETQAFDPNTDPIVLRVLSRLAPVRIGT